MSTVTSVPGTSAETPPADVNGGGPAGGPLKNALTSSTVLPSAILYTAISCACSPVLSTFTVALPSTVSGTLKANSVTPTFAPSSSPSFTDVTSLTAGFSVTVNGCTIPLAAWGCPSAG